MDYKPLKLAFSLANFPFFYQINSGSLLFFLNGKWLPLPPLITSSLVIFLGNPPLFKILLANLQIGITLLADTTEEDENTPHKSIDSDFAKTTEEIENELLEIRQRLEKLEALHAEREKVKARRV